MMRVELAKEKWEIISFQLSHRIFIFCWLFALCVQKFPYTLIHMHNVDDDDGCCGIGYCACYTHACWVRTIAEIEGLDFNTLLLYPIHIHSIHNTRFQYSSLLFRLIDISFPFSTFLPISPHLQYSSFHQHHHPPVNLTVVTFTSPHHRASFWNGFRSFLPLLLTIFCLLLSTVQNFCSLYFFR